MIIAKKLKVKEVDNNPVYGLYYSSSGDRVDEGTAEAVDENNYYGRVILIEKSFLDQIVHVPKLFPLLHWSQNIFCFLCSSTPSHGDKNFSASMGISMGK